jgi:hypothetical protein
MWVLKLSCFKQENRIIWRTVDKRVPAAKYLVLMAYEAFAPVELAELQVVGLTMEAAATLADYFCFSTVGG